MEPCNTLTPEPRFVRRAQLPELTGIPLATWETWATRPPAKGPPPTLKVGARVLYCWPEIAAWLESLAELEAAAAEPPGARKQQGGAPPRPRRRQRSPQPLAALEGGSAGEGA